MTEIPTTTNDSFASLGLNEPIQKALAELDFSAPTPIQARAIPELLKGRDLLGIAQTGTGKTGAFGLPVIQHLLAENLRVRPYGTRALILAPTRELALQINESIRKFAAGTGIRTVVILGGVGRMPQVQRMQRGTDIVIGTPGRLLDLMNTRELILDQVSHFVLDEGDQMLDLGFIKDIRSILAKLPAKRQSMLFSATMPKEIGQLASSLLRDPVRVEVKAETATPDKIEQHVYFSDAGAKKRLLVGLLKDPTLARVIVFTRTKRGADKVAEHLSASGIPADAMHGNKSQNARQRILDRFKGGQARVLVATDLAARGIHVTGITHVINYELPNEPESYVHRIGRTARAGASGVAYAFCDPTERTFLRDIQKLTGVVMNVSKLEGITPANDVEMAALSDGVAQAPKPRMSEDRPKRRGRRSGSGRRPRQNRAA
ncbi:MAG TPA: DEAD/DEAH box helicase [Acidisoma sp.]|uniref:DEAD/DEAH box helicase n=1 Tax=Acidisoma sp. TaxID=1872115 RepID=UPI002BE5FE43|nr:DEAD/DEAH box helicase [Acidisoma sp.]HTI02920.1 DEAD/DEAH box helicase [Acidisoma sp.]